MLQCVNGLYAVSANILFDFTELRKKITDDNILQVARGDLLMTWITDELAGAFSTDDVDDCDEMAEE